MKLIEGDIREATETYICHQTNCVSTGAAGLAKALFDKFPWSDCYSDREELDGPDEPGSILIRGDGKSERYVLAMMGQFYPGRPRFKESKVDGSEARKNYFRRCLSWLRKLADKEPGATFAFPWKIGCGLAGGGWKWYSAELSDFANVIGPDRVVIYRYEP